MSNEDDGGWGGPPEKVTTPSAGDADDADDWAAPIINNDTSIGWADKQHGFEETQESGGGDDGSAWDDAPAQPSGGGWGDAPVSAGSGGDSQGAGGYGGGGGGGGCFKCGQDGHFARECPNAEQFGSECYRCHKRGHFARECPASGGGGGQECFKCHQVGHISRDCPSAFGARDNGYAQRGQSQQSFGGSQAGSASVQQSQPADSWGNDNAQPASGGGGGWGDSAPAQGSNDADGGGWGGDSAPAQESNDTDDGGWGSAHAAPVDWSVPPPRTYPPAKDLHLGHLDADRDGGVGIHVSSLTTGRPWEKQFVPPSADQGWAGFKKRGGSKSGSQTGRSERGSQYGGEGRGGSGAASKGGRFGGPSEGGWGGAAPQQSNDSWGAPASAPASQAPAGGESRWSAAPEPASTDSNNEDDDAGGWGATPAVIRAPSPASKPSAQQSSSFAEEPATTASVQQSTSWADDTSPEPQAEAGDAGGWGAEPASSAPAAPGGGGGWGDDTPAPSGGGGGWGDDTPASSGGGGGWGDAPAPSSGFGADSYGGGGGGGGGGGCFKCGQDGHFARECPSAGGTGRGGDGCFKCGEQGHFSRECPNGPSQGGGNGEGCFKCGEQGHFSRECPNGPGQGGSECYRCHERGHFSRECPNGGGGGGYGNSGPRYSGFGAPVTGTNSVGLPTTGEVTGWGARKAFLAENGNWPPADPGYGNGRGSNSRPGWGTSALAKEREPGYEPFANHKVELPKYKKDFMQGSEAWDHDDDHNPAIADIAQESEHDSNTGWGGRAKPAAPPVVESNWGGAPVATDDGDDDAGGWGAPTPKAGNTKLPTQDAGGWGGAAPAPAANNGGGWNDIFQQAGNQASDVSLRAFVVLAR
ncbi:hypothetical protein I350_07042 [Cryptococcus amylolentus CBS 6273]|uniref:CCHC-type domain-containing protein n=1 Tax=Cryptococcus amylolentus CBS 6273 TaxID=1296118 RepID=A0A1E3JHU6_9TREE|nr:hypothetical protein I350_07042 [Cryptococcus amylolentus CBS 6273]